MKEAYIKLHLAVILAGFTGIFGRLIHLNAGLISWYRMLIAGVVLWLYLLLTGRKWKVPSKDMMNMALTGSILGIHWLFFYGSIQYANVSVGVVCFALTSFFNALLAPLINKKRISQQELFLSGITVCGIALIFGLDASFRTGIILGVISSIFCALYTVYNERLAKGTHQRNTVILYQMLGGCLGLSIVMPLFFLIIPVGPIFPSAVDLAWLLTLSVICTLVLYGLVIGALKHISSFTASLTFNLEPLYTIILAMLIYKENRELSIGFYIGLLLIVLSLALQMYRMKMLHKNPEVAS